MHTLEIKDNKAIFTLTIPADEVLHGMKHAAEHMSEESSIPGFRPGKAPYEVVKQRVGEMKLLEAAAEELIRKAFVEAMIAEDLETLGQPYFNAVKMAPGNDMVITAEVALYPKIIELADFNKLSVERKNVEPTKETIESAKKELATMQTKEVRKTAGEILEKGDKAVVNLVMKKDGVVLEGGEGQNHGIYTGEAHYIDGMVDKILGAKEGEERTFTLPFPKDHYQKHLAGQNIDFTVTVKEIFRLEAPTIDDAFAKTLGFDSLAKLEEKLLENLRAENQHEEEIREDREILDLLAEKSKFEEIPDLLLNQEIEKMIQELQHSIKERGLEFEAYLKSINKSLADLKLDFSAPALRRVQVGLILKKISEDQKIIVPEDVIDKELDDIAAEYDNAEIKKRVYEPVYREYVRHQKKNRMTIDFLKSKMVK
ncbi:MAG: trigger factor [Patescibacteria group bacterium]|jgi:trigger factor